MKSRKGFTLIEMIVVVAVVAILTAIAVPNVYGYMVSSEMMKVNQTAKTLFLAAQDYLTEATVSGMIDDINLTSNKVDGEALSASPMAAENSGEIVYLSIRKDRQPGQGDESLRKILSQYIGDKPMLNQSILIEYNKKSGVVRSVFYSERADFLDYSGAVTANTNVILRDDKALREKRQGYYGVSYTGAVQDDIKLKTSDVSLVNSDRLYVEWNDIAPSSDMDRLTYTLVVSSTDKDNPAEYLRIEGIPNAARLSKMGVSSLAAAEANPLTGLSTAWNGTWVNGDEETSHSIAVYTSGNKTKIALILDDLHNSIFEHYPTIPVDNITVSIRPNLDWMEGDSSYSNAAHAYFGDQPSNLTSFWDSFFKKTDTAYLLYNARHLNNIRYAPADNDYVLQNNIDWKTPEADSCKGEPKQFETVNFREHVYYLSNGKLRLEDGEPFVALTTSGYRGIFEGKGNVIAGLEIVRADSLSGAAYDLTKNIGFFARLDGAHIERLILNDVQLCLDAPAGGMDYSNVGALAGYAENSEINLCSIKNQKDGSKVTAARNKSGEANVGGFLGYAENCTLTACANAAEVGSGSAVSTGGRRRVENGGSNTGGFIGYAKNTNIDNTGATSTGTASVFGGDNVGGLVGKMSNGSIQNHLSALVNLLDANVVAGRDAVGGIVGFNQGGTLINVKITDMDLLNSSGKDARFADVLKELDGGTDIFADNASSYADGFHGVWGQKMVGGIVGYTEGGSLKDITSAVEIRGTGAVGGIIGQSRGNTSLSYTNKNTAVSGGAVVCAGDYAGGIYGINGGNTLSGLTSGAHVLAARYAGGVVGANGAEESGLDLSRSITSCRSQGVAYAYDCYGGGIAGRNMGKISDCETASSASSFSMTLGEYIGGITGFNGGTIENCRAQSPVLGGDYVGGITGRNDGTIQDCTAGSTVSGANYVGGIAGKNNGEGRMVNCSTEGGTVQATGDFAGGLIGLNTTGQFEEDKGMALKNLATLVKGRRFVGGLIGGNITASGKLALQADNGKKTQDAAAYQVTGEAFVGGIIGYNCKQEDLDALPNPYESLDLTPPEDGTGMGTTQLLHCTNYAQVKGVRYVGGMIGLNSPKTALRLTTCTNRGAVAYDKSLSTEAGRLPAIQRDGYYYIAGITGRNTVTGVIEGCENLGSITNNSLYTGGLVEVNEGIMYRCNNGGSIEVDKKFLGGIAGLNRGNGKPPAVTASSAEGSAVIDSPTAIILECTTSMGTLKGISFIGGIAAENQAVLKECRMLGGTMSGTYNAIGGVAGYNTKTGVLEQCSTLGGTVQGKSLIGGIVGYNDAEEGVNGTAGAPLQNNAKVYGIGYVGGIVGYSTQKTLEYCENGADGIVITGGAPTKFVLSGSDGKVIKEFQPNGNVGGITSFLESGKTLKNCANLGAVVGKNTAGGLVGTIESGGMVTGCRNEGRVIASGNGGDLLKSGSTLSVVKPSASNAGGIAGVNNGTIENCVLKGLASGISNVEGMYNIGGIAGQNSGGAITACTVISGDGTDAAEEKTVYTVTGTGNTGGLVGYWSGGEISNAVDGKPVNITVIGNYRSGAQSALVKNIPYTQAGERTYELCIGGIVGLSANSEATKTLEGFTFAGKVDYKTAVPKNGAFGRMYAGGIIGYNQNGCTVKNCRLEAGATVSGKSDASLINSDSSSYDILLTVGVGGITGFNNGVVENCALLGDEDNKTVVKGNFSVGGLIGSNYLDGTLTGDVSNGEKGKTRILSLTEKGADQAALGGYIGTNYSEKALVRDEDTRLVNRTEVTGSRIVGGIVGLNAGSMKYCENEGTVKGTNNRVGGITGATVLLNDLSGFAPDRKTIRVADCLNRGTVTNSGGAACGGITGYTNTQGGRTIVVESCRNEDTVSGITRTGGMIGAMYGAPTVQNCENTADGIVSSSGALTGGIIGYSNGGTVAACRNEGSVSSKASSGEVGIGGITGYMDGSGVYSVCVNNGTIKANGGSGAGGIAGIALKYTTTETGGIQFIECTNETPIALPKMSSVGGIAGAGVGMKLQECSNKVNITGDNQVGGIVGAFTKTNNGSPNLNWMYNCVNSGGISGYRIGGIAGSTTNAESAFYIKDCTNSGTISVTQPGDKNTNGGAGIMGRDFSSTGGVNQIIGCTNTGEVLIKGAGQREGLGGIAGFISKPILIKNCTNTGRVSDGADSGTAEYMGGIVGYLGSGDAIVDNCINLGNVDAARGSDTLDGAYIGGIAGYNCGTVRSCQNGGPEATGQTIRGRNSVGGIAGINSGAKAFVYSGTLGVELQSGDKVTCNYMDITASNTYAGGIVGYNQGGGVISTMNLAAVTSKGAAGGLIGAATSVNYTNNRNTGVAGTLANSFNLGEVYGSGSATGGLIGQRLNAYASKEGHNVKNSFYLGKDYPEGTSLARLVIQDILSIGNEPDLEKTVGENDTPKKEDSLLYGRVLSNSLLKAYGMAPLNPEDWKDLEKVLAVVKEILKKPEYRLDQPRDVSTVSDEAYSYTTSWEMVQGMVKGYSVYLRPKGAEDNTSDIFVANVEDIDESGRLKTTCTFDIRKVYEQNKEKFSAQGQATFEEIIGLQYDVVVVTRGIHEEKMEDGKVVLVGALDSVDQVSESDRRILPILPAPEDDTHKIVKIVGENRVYTFQIPKEIYDAVIDRRQYPNLPDDALYTEPYTGGLEGFKVYELDTDGSLKAEMNKTPVEADDLFSFLVAHTDESKTHYKIGIQAMSNNAETGYAHSLRAVLEYNVQTRLPAPTGLNHAYVSMDKDGVLTYKLSWKSVPHAEGYEIAVTCGDKTITYRVNGVNTKTFQWTTKDFDIPVGEPAKVGFVVRALGQDSLEPQPDEVVYLTSYDSGVREFTLPAKLQPPEMTVASADETLDNKYTLGWTQEEDVQFSGFELTILRREYPDGTREKVYKETQSLDKALRTQELPLFGEDDFGYTYIFQMRAKGISGVSIDSETAEYEFTLYPRLPKPSKLAELKAAGDKRTFLMKWDGKTDGNKDYPAEAENFTVFVYLSGGTESVDQLILTRQQLTDGYEYTFNADLKSETYWLYLRAEAVEGAYARSEKSGNQSLFLPGPLPNVEGLKALVKVDGKEPSAPVPMAEYTEKGVVNLQWTKMAAASQSLMEESGSFRIRVTVGQEGDDITGLLPSADSKTLDEWFKSSKPDTVSASFKLPLAYAGKELYISMQAVGGEKALDSEWSEPVAVKLPKAQLTAPEFEAKFEKNGGKWAVRFTPRDPDNKLAGLITNHVKPENIKGGFFRFEAEYTWQEKNEDGTLSEEHTGTAILDYPRQAAEDGTSEENLLSYESLIDPSVPAFKELILEDIEATDGGGASQDVKALIDQIKAKIIADVLEESKKDGTEVVLTPEQIELTKVEVKKAALQLVAAGETEEAGFTDSPDFEPASEVEP